MSAVGVELVVVGVEAAKEHAVYSEVDYKDMEEVASAEEEHNVGIGIRLVVAEVRSE